MLWLSRRTGMAGIGRCRVEQWKKEAEMIAAVLENCETVDKCSGVSTEEFLRRQSAVYGALKKQGIDVGFVFCDQHYNGDVPYLGGNTNITIEQVAGAIGKAGFHIIAGLEGGYVAEQLAPRSRSRVHKVEMLQLADEKYPIKAERLEDVLEAAAGGRIRNVGLLTPRQVVPDSIVRYLEAIFGKDNILDAQGIYYRIKNEKSDEEMRLIRDAGKIADAMMRGMVAVLKPGMMETQVASWGYLIARELGSEEMGWDVMVTANEANRTLIGKALNRPIHEGDYVHIGVAPKRDGLNACLRRSMIAVADPSMVTPEQKYWFDFIEEAYDVGFASYCEVAAKNLPAKLQEQALVDYFRSRSDEISEKIGRKIDLAMQKPYTGTHNAGYTECQEFYGAITLESDEPLGHQIVTMLDVAIRGIGDRWDDIVIPGMDFVLIENTLGKFGTQVENFNERTPKNVQKMVGNVR